MLAWNRLRIDCENGSRVVDYRIENGSVESRSLRLRNGETVVAGQQWHRLTPEELSSLVKSNQVLAQWLTRRMGVFAVVRACNTPAYEAGAGSVDMAA
jgi:hypothetical protein